MNKELWFIYVFKFLYIQRAYNINIDNSKGTKELHDMTFLQYLTARRNGIETKIHNMYT